MQRTGVGKNAGRVHDLPGAMFFEPNAPDCAVTVCGKGSLLTHTTTSPGRTRRVCGSKRVPSITTVCVTGLARAVKPGTVSTKPAVIHSAAARNRRSEPVTLAGTTSCRVNLVSAWHAPSEPRRQAVPLPAEISVLRSWHWESGSCPWRRSPPGDT